MAKAENGNGLPRQPLTHSR